MDNLREICLMGTRLFKSKCSKPTVLSFNCMNCLNWLHYPEPQTWTPSHKPRILWSLKCIHLSMLSFHGVTGPSEHSGCHSRTFFCMFTEKCSSNFTNRLAEHVNEWILQYYFQMFGKKKINRDCRNMPDELHIVIANIIFLYLKCWLNAQK